LRFGSRWSALAVLALVGLVASACASSGGSPKGKGDTSGAPSSAPASSHASAPAGRSSTVTVPTVAAKKVHVSGYPDGSTVGVGMPIIATFNRRITSGVEFAKNTTVTVNGHPVNGGWYFENSDPKSGHRMEAHYRMRTYWPAHAHVHVTFKLRGVSAGKGLAFDGKLTSLDFFTGPRNIGVVNDASHRIVVTSDGVKKFDMPVSLGATNTPTARGTKVIMEKGVSICMHGPGYSECGVKYTQRLTYGGEYLHAAPWNTSNITRGVDSSNGCTNLFTNDAKTLYGFLRIGDVVEYPNANGPAMTMGAGYGDWNVPWVEWQSGGAVPVS
jgi:lipoprotein-anchoring transpeptidase ErfK/SrfK